MSNKWPTVKVGDVLSLNTNRVSVDPSVTYPMVGVLSFGRGLFDREPIVNGNTSYKFFHRLDSDHFVMSQLFGWEGALALSSEDYAGKYLSPQFPTFRCNSAKLDRKFLGWVTRRPDFWDQLGKKASGMGDRRRTLTPDALLTSEIPLPPLSEQHRIVDLIEAIAGKVEEARRLRGEAGEEAEAALASTINLACSGHFSCQSQTRESASELLQRIAKLKRPDQVAPRKRAPMPLPPPPQVPPSWVVAQAGELQGSGAILDIQDGNHGSEYPRKAEFGDAGVSFVTAKQINSGVVDIASAPRLPHERAKQLRIGFAKASDVLLTHNASVGDVAVAPEDADSFLLGTSVTYWRCNPDALVPHYLAYFMRSEHFQSQLRFIMKQTTRNQVSVLKQVNLWICLPPLEEQRRIARALHEIEEAISALILIQKQVSTEAGALLPSMLDKAFRGEM